MNNYNIEERISYAEATSFFKQYLKCFNLINLIYYCNIFGTFVVIIIYLYKILDFEQIMTNLGFALFAIIPFTIVHECIHILAYIIEGGGKDVKIGIKKGLFYSTCSNHIFSCKEYMISALLPVVLISFLCLYMFVVFENCRGWMCIFYLLQLLSSNVDVGIANYCYKNKNLYYTENHQHEEMYFIKRKDQ